MTGLVVLGLQSVVVLGRKDHGVELTRLFHEHRLALGLSRQAAKSIFSLGDTRQLSALDVVLRPEDMNRPGWDWHAL